MVFVFSFVSNIRGLQILRIFYELADFVVISHILSDSLICMFNRSNIMPSFTLPLDLSQDMSHTNRPHYMPYKQCVSDMISVAVIEFIM